MPLRPKKGLKKKTDRGMTEADQEFLLFGFNILTGYEHGFKTGNEMRQAYRKHKKYLLSLMGQADDFGYVALKYGSRPWCFYRFGFSQDMSDLYLEFQECWNNEDKRNAEFLFLEKSGFLLKDEAKQFEMQEKRHKEFKENLRLTVKPKKVLDFPKTSN